MVPFVSTLGISCSMNVDPCLGVPLLRYCYNRLKKTVNITVKQPDVYPIFFSLHRYIICFVTSKSQNKNAGYTYIRSVSLFFESYMHGISDILHGTGRASIIDRL